MSSVKRDVKKKVLRRPEGEKILFSKSSPLSVSAPDFARRLLWLVCPSCGFHLRLRRRQSSLETGQADLVRECQPWFYRRLVAYRYFWLSEEA